MRATTTDLMDFWRTPWSKPIREACAWIGDAPPIGGCPLKNAVAPWWVRPFFLQQWVVQAIVERLAWLKAHPGVPKDRFGRDSETEWEEVTWTFAEAWCLREMSEETLLMCFACDVERLLRILEESPTLVGAVVWTQAVLVACGHLAQYYGELKRRHTALGARAIVREQLRQFVTWPPNPYLAAAAAAQRGGGASEDGGTDLGTFERWPEATQGDVKVGTFTARGTGTPLGDFCIALKPPRAACEIRPPAL